MKANHLLFPLLLWGTLAQAKTNSLAVTAGNTLNFIENKGQVHDQYGKPRTDIDYRVGAAGVNMFIGKGQLHYQWAAPPTKKIPGEVQPSQTGMYRMDVTLVGANINAQVIHEQKQSYYERYYLPVFGEQGITALAYQKITYKNVYPNIDWVLYVKDNAIEYDFVVRPGGKVSDIQLQYGGATTLATDNSGTLTATTPMGSITEQAPISHQDDDKQVATRFVLNGSTLSFSAAAYSGTLVIDPTLGWSTYYGGSGDETITGGCVAGDNYGNGYLVGSTESTSGIATTGSYQDTLTPPGSPDAFLVKFNASGARQWATYYGGEGEEDVNGTTCDWDGNVYISGYTNSEIGIASVGAYQTYLDSFYYRDAFLIKFDSTGARLWGTYFGGENQEEGYAVACDKSNNIYLTGTTGSTTEIATAGAYQTSLGGGLDGFIAKFNSSGSLQWATYYGGSGKENGLGIACDSNKNVFLTGITKSTSSIATAGAYQTSYGGTQDGFLAKFDSSGNLQWSTYFGGPSFDAVAAVVCDVAGSAYITGNTSSMSAIATVGSFQNTFGGGAGDIFISKFSGSGSLQWSTYYGGAAADAGLSLSYRLGNIYMSGVTQTITGLATPGAFQDTGETGQDAILVRFDTAGNRSWATYFGGGDNDGCGVYCNSTSNVFLGGSTSAGIYTTAGCYQSTFGGGIEDGYLAVFNDCILQQPDTLIGHDTICRGSSYTFYVPAIAGAISYTWTLPTGWSGSSITDTIHITAGTHSDTIKVAANYACGTSTQLTKIIRINPLPTIISAGTSSICNGDSIILTSSTGTAYQWLQGGFIISGANSNSYTVHTGNHYSVIVTSISGCADTSTADTIIVHPAPVPVITASGMVLSTGTYTSYQWNRNGTAIIGAINSTYTMVIDSGDYTVTVVDSTGCTGTSAVYNPTESVVNVKANNIVDVYPNPTNGVIYITTTQKVNVTVTSIDGRQLATYREPKQIDLSNLSDGIYLLRIVDNKGGLISIQKMVKAKTR